MQLFRGLSAFPLTPADDRGHVDAHSLIRIIDRLVDANVDSIGLLGSTGIYVYLTREERRRAVQAAARVINGKVPLIVGVGALRTDDVIRLAKDAADEGADGLLLAPVSYAPLTDEEVYQHFVAVAAATDRPLCIYNNPSTTHFTFSAALLARLAGVQNIEAVKMPLPTKWSVAAELTGLRDTTMGKLAIGYSGDWGIADAILAGADAFYSGAAAILPREVLSLVRAAQVGNADEVRRIDAAFKPLWTLCKEFGGLRVFYVIARLLNLSDANPPLPILPLKRESERRIADALVAITSAI
jgi:4-hydroxy-tetrahydrodipicolinate synthase